MSIEAIVARYGLAAIFVGAGIEGETAVVTGGVLAHHGLVPLWATMLAAVAGSFVADQLFFASGRRFRDAGPIRRIRARPAFAKALALLERHPRGFIFAYRFVVNIVAAIVWGTLFSMIGYLFGNVIAETVGRIDTRTLLIGAAIVLSGAIGIGWMVKRRRTA